MKNQFIDCIKVVGDKTCRVVGDGTVIKAIGLNESTVANFVLNGLELGLSKSYTGPNCASELLSVLYKLDVTLPIMSMTKSPLVKIIDMLATTQYDDNVFIKSDDTVIACFLRDYKLYIIPYSTLHMNNILTIISQVIQIETYMIDIREPLNEGIFVHKAILHDIGLIKEVNKLL